MKVSPVRMILFLLCVSMVAAALVLSQQQPVVGEESRYKVRMPVDPRIIEFEDPAEAPRLVKDDPVDDAVAAPEGGRKGGENVSAQQESAKSVEESASARPSPSPAAKTPARKASSQKAAAIGGNIAKLGLDLREDNSFVVRATASRPLGKVATLWLEKPGRLVIDILGRWQLNARTVVRVRKGPVKHMVAGEHPDRLRLVVHFRSQPKNSAKPDVKIDGKNLVVTVNP